ncbi:AAA family ATPase [Candidatus Poribacteria bacterium]|nr:AAA family ATPase [Candidatus Poribacteria bacterium]
MSYFKAYLDIIKRRSFVILASLMIVAGSALVVALHAEKGYEAAAIIDVQQSGPPAGATGLVRTVLLGGEESTMLETLSRRIGTEAFLNTVVDEFERRYPRGAALLPSPSALVSRIKPQVIPGTRYIAIKVKLRESEGGARNAAILANLAVKTLQEILSTENTERATAQIKFIDSKIEEVRREIESIKEEMLRFVRKSGNPSIWSAQLEHLLAQQQSLFEERNRAELGVEASMESLRSIDAQLRKIPELTETARVISQSPLLIQQMTDLARLEVEIAGAKVRYSENSDELKSLQARKARIEEKIRELSDKMAVSKTISTDPRYHQLLSSKINGELGLIKYKAQLKMVDKRLAQIGSKLSSLLIDVPEKQLEFEGMTRQMESAYDLMKELMRRRIEAEILLNEGNIVSGTGIYSRKGGVMLIQPARPQLYPVSPNLRFTLVISSVVGLALGLALAFSFEFLDGRFHSPFMASRSLNLPILGTIAPRRGRFEGIPEEIDGIAAGIELMRERMGFQSILVLSCLRGEGRTTVAAGTAISLSRMGRSVLLLDADIQNPSLHRLFGQDREPGLTEILNGETPIQEVVRVDETTGVHLIPAGSRLEAPMSLLRPNGIIELLESFREGYDVIICDTPALTSFLPGLIMASKADVALLVADLNMVPSATLTRTAEQLSKANIELLGVIYNRVRS